MLEHKSSYTLGYSDALLDKPERKNASFLYMEGYERGLIEVELRRRIDACATKSTTNSPMEMIQLIKGETLCG
jgi:hypothetical protein